MEGTEKKQEKKERSIWAQIFYFFPFQLLILNLKKNHILLLSWLLLFGYVSGSLATKYGVNYLFLYPEYLGKVGFWSHFMIGISIGGFVMAFNIYSYVIHAFRFPFLATLSRPFYKFSLNNFLIPLIFISYYIWKAVQFQRTVELESGSDIAFHILGFISGFVAFLSVSLLYFYGTNKDVFGFLKPNTKKKKGRFADLYDSFIRERARQSSKSWRQRPWRVESYLQTPVRVAIARASEHYDKETLRKVFRQNHFNASLFELLLVMSFLLVMNFGEVPIFIIPGGASVILVFTLMLMLLSVLLSWFRGWATSVFVALILLANLFSSSGTFLPQVNTLYGLDMQAPKKKYDFNTLSGFKDNEETLVKDLGKMEELLALRIPATSDSLSEKPKLLFINCSGGGLRSALWTTSILSELDSLMEGRLMEETCMITGASGGMLGAAYLRESYLQNDQKNIYSMSDRMGENIAKDILNPVLLSIASSDLFFQVGSFEYGDVTYPKDRAYRFEEQFLNNTDRTLDKPLIDYREVESRAEVPMMILYPTIVNDGRKMLVSPLDLSFMCGTDSELDQYLDHQIEMVEYRKILGDKDADATRFSSLLRANATFPYILPQVSLPTEPNIKLMDAGIRDNFGYTVTFKFIAAMKDWIEENTSGVVLVQVRDQRKDIQQEIQSDGILTRLTSPLGNVYDNFIKTQDFVHDELYLSTKKWLDVPMEEVILQMEQSGTEKVSMSWHLTALEKQIISQSVYNVENQDALQRILDLLSIRESERSGR